MRWAWVVSAVVVGSLLVVIVVGAIADSLWPVALLALGGLLFVMPSRVIRLVRLDRLRRRARIILASTALLISLAVIGATAPVTPEDAEKRRLAARHAEAEKAAAAAAAERDLAASRRREVLAGYRRMLGQAKTCDRSVAGMAKIVAGIANGGSTMVDAYASARDSQAACEKAASAIADLRGSGILTDEQRSAYDRAVDVCVSTYSTKRRVAEGLMALLDGDAKPSSVLQVRETMAGLPAAVITCVASWIDAGSKAGLQPSEMA